MKKVTLTVNLPKETYRYLAEVEDSTDPIAIEASGHLHGVIVALADAIRLHEKQAKACHRFWRKDKCVRKEDGYCAECHASFY